MLLSFHSEGKRLYTKELNKQLNTEIKITTQKIKTLKEKFIQKLKNTDYLNF